MQGKRINDADDRLKPGEYGWSNGYNTWLINTPNGLMGNLANHDVLEHEDGTITVSPSILVNGYSYDEKKDISWHGYLEHGIWREV